MSPKLAALYRYWESKLQPDGGLPRRRDIDPVEIARAKPELMPHLWLVDVLRGPYRFRYRLLGGALTDAGAPGRVGELLDASVGARAGSLHDNLVKVCEEKSWNYRSGAPTLPHDAHVEAIERLSLPLIDDSGLVAVILSGSIYRWEEGWGPRRR